MVSKIELKQDNLHDGIQLSYPIMFVVALNQPVTKDTLKRAMERGFIDTDKQIEVLVMDVI